MKRKPGRPSKSYLKDRKDVAKDDTKEMAKAKRAKKIDLKDAKKDDKMEMAKKKAPKKRK